MGVLLKFRNVCRQVIYLGFQCLDGVTADNILAKICVHTTLYNYSSSLAISHPTPPLQVTAAELTQVYHMVKHNLSQNSADSGNKINQKILITPMAKDVLAPKAVADVDDVFTSGKSRPVLHTDG